MKDKKRGAREARGEAMLKERRVKEPGLVVTQVAVRKTFLSVAGALPTMSEWWGLLRRRRLRLSSWTRTRM